MKILLSVFTLLFSANVFSAPQCKQYQQPLLATYQISYNNQHNQKVQQTLQILRSKNQITYIYPQQAISEQWLLQKNSNMRLTRYFEKYQRGIEYQAADMPDLDQAKASWLQKYQLISPTFISQLQKEKTEDKECNPAEIFHSKAESKQQVSLKWNAYYQLPISLTINQFQNNTVWQLLDLQSNEQQISEKLTNYDNFQLTDYADIGDNEADPFLAKMINQGFIKHSHSGFYSSNGGAM
ncbi:MAG: hypothetical protein GY951_09050 [Psychromonas sp.]|nr:hypothetical protein [Alteromonadales bacterium]MCP5078186.1 hypothetical protein [Psychromonas sp.]